jgi:UDP-N-acetylglucosamine 2-epimerase (non-hydrolysing)
MPEEINRLLTDQISDLLFTPSPDANENLLREGVTPKKIKLVGNVMIDTLVRTLPKALARWKSGLLASVFSENPGSYGLVTLHRPSNVDDSDTLISLMNALSLISRELPLLFPIHPRTRQRLESSNIKVSNSNLYLIDPLSYLDFLALQCHATLVITDSGGIQEETTYLGIPCLTLRENTERPVTVTMGTNIVVGQDMKRLRNAVDQILSGNRKQGKAVPLWDGHAAERIGDVIMSWWHERQGQACRS